MTVHRPAWLTDEHLAELQAIGMAVPEPDGCPCCYETQHACGCPVAAIGLAVLLKAEGHGKMLDGTHTASDKPWSSL